MSGDEANLKDDYDYEDGVPIFKRRWARGKRATDAEHSQR
jgi:hypothetical protein